MGVLGKMIEIIKRLLMLRQQAVVPPPYRLEDDARVASILGINGFEFSRRLELAQRIDPAKFNEAIDAAINRTGDDLQKEYGRFHRRRFFELFNHCAELVAGLESPMVLEFGVSGQTQMYKTFIPGIQLHVADYVKPGCCATGDMSIDESYSIDLTRRASRVASLIPQGSFDLVIFAEVIEHLFANPIEIIGWLLTLLKPSGHLIITTPNMFSKHNMPVFMSYDNPLEPFPNEDDRVANSHKHLREYSHIELLRFVQAAGGDTKAFIFSSCWDDDETLAPVERKNLVLVASPK